MKTILKSVVVSILMLGITGAVNAQKRSSGFDWEKVVYGGSVLPFISNTGVFVTANPFVGYKVTDRFVPGVMFSYQYSSYRQSGLTEVYNLFGVSPFVRHTVLDKFFVQAEYEFLNGNFEIKPIYPDKIKFSEQNLLLGGGYYSPNGIFAQVMYNVTWKGNTGRTVYASPWVIRAGFSIF